MLKEYVLQCLFLDALKLLSFLAKATIVFWLEKILGLITLTVKVDKSNDLYCVLSTEDS